MDEEIPIPFFVFVFVGIITILALVETGIFVYAYFHADTVKCNWIWCEFSSGELVESRITTSSQCSINNVTINCSKMPDWDKESGIDRYLQ
jgi:hypothetical protein